MTPACGFRILFLLLFCWMSTSKSIYHFTLLQACISIKQCVLLIEHILWFLREFLGNSYFLTFWNKSISCLFIHQLILILFHFQMHCSVPCHSQHYLLNSQLWNSTFIAATITWFYPRSNLHFNLRSNPFLNPISWEICYSNLFPSPYFPMSFLLLNLLYATFL